MRRIRSDKRIQILVHNLFIGAEATQHEEKSDVIKTCLVYFLVTSGVESQPNFPVGP